MPLYETDKDIWEGAAMPRKKSMPKKKAAFDDEMDVDMESFEKGKTKQSDLPTARRGFGGKKLSTRPRFGGMSVGQ